jgi:hypothetical protein
LRQKLTYTGRQLDEVFLMEPSAKSWTGTGTSNTSSGSQPNPSPSPNPVPRPGDIFDHRSSTNKPRIQLSNPPTSPLNLIGTLEVWGIGPATTVEEVSIKVSAATGAQLKELLKKLPDGMTFELNLEKEDN